MGLVKISCFSLFVFCFFALKASDIDEESWQLSGTFFLEKKCYISIQDTRKSEKDTMQNSSMMVLNCEPFLPMLQEMFPMKVKVRECDRLRYVACYNSFCNRQLILSKVLSGEFYEIDLVGDSYLRSIVILTVQEHLKSCDNFTSVFFAGKILDLLGVKRP
jgi:hypothetical protein